MTNQPRPSSASDEAHRPPEPRGNGLAIASLCVSVAGLVTCFGAVLLGLIGAILGHIALRSIDRDPGHYRNRGVALAGVIVGWIAFVLMGIGSFLFFFVVTAPSESSSVLNGILRTIFGG
ncbi:uncharacterized protein DUF4190 [Saccharopolyspora erythraea NRRL 2338]|uniref:Uncharacterized protein n=2 Tax=Saccharopolyspora erythraea TaxID=1836 RepID=A4FJ14_SACEN|nr:DUF4190 domain-containing protein [Saccharopolyspora erythraea]EQD86140.1 hypothetical protein N599_10990 [Saccharopolyspora erythraea D]PFG97709.1 uncharacterized protein DUF4190 [Saccharopolyspora erythraea NRRL 2338]QRK87858.1 DUF4190 domain-containing protein [Saccharopolyspora erythraea]CAM04039.1 hypothetical protein SACE_4771 [Saccharopolyspora erythraea NRRL 2338]